MNFLTNKAQGFVEKTSWNNSNTVLVLQRQGQVVTDYKNRQSLLSALQLMSISKIRTQKYGSGHSEPI